MISSSLRPDQIAWLVSPANPRSAAFADLEQLKKHLKAAQWFARGAGPERRILRAQIQESLRLVALVRKESRRV